MDPIVGATIAGSSGAASSAFAPLAQAATFGGNILAALAGGRYSSKQSGDIRHMDWLNRVRALKDQETYRQWQLNDQVRYRNWDLKDDARDWWRTQYMAKNSAGWQFDDLMQAADKSGIHRLSAIGGAGAASYTPAQSTPPPSMGSGPSGLGTVPTVTDENNFIGDMVGNVLKMARDQERESMAAKMGRKELELLDAQIRQIDAATSRTQIHNQRLAELNNAENPDKLPTRDDPLVYQIDEVLTKDANEGQLPQRLLTWLKRNAHKGAYTVADSIADRWLRTGRIGHNTYNHIQSIISQYKPKNIKEGHRFE